MAKSKGKCPLWQRADGRWCKKVRGKVFYFGADKKAALAEWDRVSADILAGHEPREEVGNSVADIANAFLAAKLDAVDLGELAHVSFESYLRTARDLTACFGRDCPVASLTPQDFAKLRNFIGHGRAASTLQLRIKKTRVLFRWAFESELLDKPVRYGQSFDPPSETVIARQREETGERLFSGEQIHWLLGNAVHTLRPLILIGINCAFGPADIGRLAFKHIDMEGGWVTMSRSKTATRRRCKLWPETVQAIEAWLVRRPKPAQAKWRDTVFLTRHGQSWAQRAAHYAPLTSQFRELLQKGEMWEPRSGFYTLRRTFRTQADEVRDDPAIDLIMGHKTPGMGSVYRQRIDDTRIKAVCDHVREWLFG